MNPTPLTDAQRDQAAGWVLGLRQAADLADLSGAGVVSSADLRKAADAMSASVGAASQAPARPAPAATHTDPAAQGGAQALRDFADELRVVFAPAWGGDRAWMTTGNRVAHLVAATAEDHAITLAAQAPDTPGQRTVTVTVYTDEPGPDVTEVEPLFFGGKVATGTGFPWAVLRAAHGPLVPVGTRARLRGDS